MRLPLVLIIVLTALHLSAQNIPFDNIHFDSQEILDKALKTIDKGDGYFFSGEFNKALPYFLEAQDYNSNNALLNFKIGVCYFKANRLNKALPYFEKAKKLNPKIDPKIDFALAVSYQENKEYKKAITAYQNYLTSLSPTKRKLETSKVQENIAICTSKLQKTDIPSPPKEKLAENIQSKPKTPAPKQTTKVLPKPQANPKVKPEEKPKPVPSKTKKQGISYRVQIAAASSAISKTELQRIYSGPFDITSEVIGGMHKYFIGDFETKKEAFKLQADSGVNGSFVARFKNGKRY